MPDIDESAIRSLDEELVGWLTTVTPGGQPQSSIVWFLRDGEDLLIYSRPGVGKLRNIAANPKVAFNLRSDREGDEVLTLEAMASVVEDARPAHQDPIYLAKYDASIRRLGWTPPEFAGEYPILLRLTVTRLRYDRG